MFHRKRATSNPPRVVKAPPSQAASLAATQAFLANRASNGDLSAAAAAAALRSHTTSPAPVGQIQTKRMQRRGSLSSNGSAPDRPGLLRRTSSGSMTERTFRDPSPSRPASSHGPYVIQDEAPPVPALPKNIPQPPQAVSAQQRAARRAASMEPPERISSPPPRVGGGRGVSLDRGPGSYKPNGASKNANGKSVDRVGELERPGSRNSVNFSRPMSPQNSPPQSPLTGGRVKSPPPSKSAGSARLPEGEADRILNSIQETAQAPVKKKKKKAIAKGLTGDDYAAAGLSTTSNQTKPLHAVAQQPPSTVSSPLLSSTVTMSSGTGELPRPKKKKKKSASSTRDQDRDAAEGYGNAYPSDTESITSERSSTNERPRSYNTRAAGLLMKQPSIVKEDREAEEQEEQRPQTKMNGQVAQISTASKSTPANTSKVVSKGGQHARVLSQTDSPQSSSYGSLVVPGAGRPQSLSPARSTHFSSQPEYETADGIKHQPPARSVSPAKSALKHSPSRGNSPIGSFSAVRRAGFAASEASDTTSNMSDDGSRSVPKKKKGARVSFDDDSVAVGRAASPSMTPDSSVILSPQNQRKGRSWFDLVREKQQEATGIDADQDSVIKPTPTLPSFGSIRRDRDQDSALDSSKNPTSRQDWAQDTIRSIDTSSDHVLGSILSRDAAAKSKENSTQIGQKKDLNEPLPPEVTSVEGSGYHSDEEASLLDDQQENKTPTAHIEAPLESTASKADQDVSSLEPSSDRLKPEAQISTVPSIALQPATPGFDTTEQGQKEWLDMPGQFPATTESSKSVQLPLSPTVERHLPEVPPAALGLAEPEPDAVATHHDPATPNIGGVAEGLRMQIESQSGDESDDTGASIYSDAAEEPDDLDGDGFGSINAIVESPALSPLVPSRSKSPSNSPGLNPSAAKTTKPGVLTRKDSELSEPASEEGWDRAQAYWSGLSQERKRQLENAAAPGALDELVIPNRTMRGPDSVKRKKKKVPNPPTSFPSSSNPPFPPWPDKQYRGDIAKTAKGPMPPLKSSLRKSHAQESQEPHMRSSMRDGPPPKSSLRNGSQRNSAQVPVSESRGALQKKSRPMSAVAMVDYNKPQSNVGTGHIRASSAGVPTSSLTPVMAQPKKKTQVKKPTLQRNDSDSSSSFKRERSATPASAKYTMKRTMRPSSADARGSADRVSSVGARTASPTASTSRRPFSTAGPAGGGMRTSMRDSVDSSRPAARTSLRESIDSKRPKSPSRFGFGKTSKQKPVDPKPASRFSSRFGDSSDEEDSRPTRSSRFADSSDDEPVGLTPVRGIPRRIDEGDSTDLEDSSVENTPAPGKSKLNGATPSLDTKPEGAALATGSLRIASGDGPTTALGTGLQAKKAAEKDKKKRSFFSGLGSKKRDDPSRIRKADIESPARRDTPLERSKTERLLATGEPKDERVLGPSSPKADPVAQAGRPAINSRTSSAQNSPKSPKLQRRNTPKRLTSATDVSWPLSQSPNGSRPQTSDGAAVSNGTGRPDIGTRRTTVQGSIPPPTAPLVVGKADKKKRFGMLRKAFGMQN